MPRIRCMVVVLSLVACTPTLDGTRAATPADRAAPVEARFVCVSPGSFKLDGPSIEEGAPTVTFALVKGPQGPLVVEGDLVTTNHWESPLGDHFFAWGSGVGGETIVAKDRQSAMQFVWGDQPNDGGAYGKTKAPDGSTRPSGTPVAVSTCIPEDVAEKRKAAQTPLLARVKARPVSSDAVPGKNELSRVACSRDGGPDVATFTLTVAGPTWMWMPHGLFETPSGKTYVTLQMGRIGAAWPMFEIEVGPDGRFDFALGAVSFKGVVGSDGKRRIASIEGTIAGRNAKELRCLYADPTP